MVRTLERLERELVWGDDETSQFITLLAEHYGVHPYYCEDAEDPQHCRVSGPYWDLPERVNRVLSSHFADIALYLRRLANSQS
jgi:hypothetical protein